MSQVTFITPSDAQYKLIWEFFENPPAPVFSWEDRSDPHDTCYLSVHDVPGVGRVLGGSGMGGGGGWDEVIISSPTATREEITAALKALYEP